MTQRRSTTAALVGLVAVVGAAAALITTAAAATTLAVATATAAVLGVLFPHFLRCVATTTPL